MAGILNALSVGFGLLGIRGNELCTQLGLFVVGKIAEIVKLVCEKENLIPEFGTCERKTGRIL